MGMFVNRVELIGNLGRDPEIRSTQAGKKIATLSIATSESWKDQQSGEWKERTEWHRVVIFNEGLAKVAEKHLTSGMKVRIEGKLRTRKWQDQVGQDRYSTEIHIENFDGSLNFDMKRDEDRASGSAGRERTREPAMAGAGGSTGAGLGGGDLYHDIRFPACGQSRRDVGERPRRALRTSSFHILFARRPGRARALMEHAHDLHAHRYCPPHSASHGGYTRAQHLRDGRSDAVAPRSRQSQRGHSIRSLRAGEALGPLDVRCGVVLLVSDGTPRLRSATSLAAMAGSYDP